jgi:DNA repair ATPase RecN
LAQVASFGSTHFYISKCDDNGKTKTKLDILDYENRVSEIARLIDRNETYVRTFLVKLVRLHRLQMKYPEMPNHPHQTYYASGIKS